MRKRSEIAARADAATAWNYGINVVIQQIAQAFRDDGARARESLGQNIRAQQHQRANFFFAERVAHAGSMAANQVVLQWR